MGEKNVFVIALDQFNRNKLEALRVASQCRFHRLIRDDELLAGTAGYDVDEMIRQGERELRGFAGTVDAVIAYRDFPESTIQPVLASGAGVPTASLEAVLKCEHKFWSRREQQKAVPDHVPRFERFHPFDNDARSQISLPYPFWMKPVKSFASHLGFKVSSDEDFERAIRETRAHIRRLAEPFDRILELAELPADTVRVGEVYCLAEQIIGGWQCTLEGCRVGGKTTTLGIVDSIRVPGGSSFLRYQYPSRLPIAVQRRMSAITEKVVEQFGYDNACFNVEFFWDEAHDQIWLLEVNPRIALHHADLFEKVDGYSNYEMAVEVALGREPSLTRDGGPFSMAATCFLRQFKDGYVTRVPSAQEVSAIEDDIDGTLIEVRAKPNKRLSELVEQDAYSYALALVYVGGRNEQELVDRFDEVVRRLDIRVSDDAPA